METETQEKEYEDNDGWNKQFFEPLTDAQDALDSICYEIRNCVRNSSIEEINETISEVISNLEDMKNKLEVD